MILSVLFGLYLVYLSLIMFLWGLIEYICTTCHKSNMQNMGIVFLFSGLFFVLMGLVAIAFTSHKHIQ